MFAYNLTFLWKDKSLEFRVHVWRTPDDWSTRGTETLEFSGKCPGTRVEPKPWRVLAITGARVEREPWNVLERPVARV